MARSAGESRHARYVLLAIAIAGCSVPGQPAGDFARSRGGATTANPVFATQLAGPSTFLAPMPTAVVVLKPDDLNRNRAFCAALTRRLPSAQQALAGSVVAPNLVLTRWLVQLADVPAERATDCDFLVGTYDYARAARLLGRVQLTAGSLVGRGPFLLMIVPDESGLRVAGLDGSGYGADTLTAFVDSWGSALQETNAAVSRQSDQPGIVRSLFGLIAAILRTAAGIVGGVVQGVVSAL